MQKIVSRNVQEEKTFLAEYEAKLHLLKRDFVRYQQLQIARVSEAHLSQRWQHYQRGVQQLRLLVNKHWRQFDAVRCSSLYCVPTRQLNAEEKCIHRIWLGGAVPDLAVTVMCQWENALAAIKAEKTSAWTEVLWVWEANQLEGDNRFTPLAQPHDEIVGMYDTGLQILVVRSLTALADRKSPSSVNFLRQLHEKHYYATLSDYFRFLILIEMGGIYMDIDTIPYRSATRFLIKPEVPDYLIYDSEGTYHVSWLNLFLDETGMVISRKNNNALVQILNGLEAFYHQLSDDVPQKDANYERMLFDGLYKLWRQHLNHTNISHCLFSQNYSVFNNVQELVICGVRGMRLTEDIITAASLPLSAQEQESYQHCVNKLAPLDWQLADPLMLAEYAEIFSIMEVPRMAYPAQIRSDIEHYHYYSVLSCDEKLDRVNQLFGEYLIAKNQKAIGCGRFWQAFRGINETVFFEQPLTLAIHFIPAWQVDDEIKNRMAKLMFSTSYLEYCSVANRAGLSLVEVQKKQNIEPYLDTINALYDENEEFFGFYNAARYQELADIQAGYYYRDEVQQLDCRYEDFLQCHCALDDYFIATIAIEASHQKQGYFSHIFKHIEAHARQLQAPRIVLCVWQSSEAYAIYLHKGFQVAAEFDYPWQLFFDKLLFLEYKL